jgi:hypothetical protein
MWGNLLLNINNHHFDSLERFPIFNEREIRLGTQEDTTTQATGLV